MLGFVWDSNGHRLSIGNMHLHFPLTWQSNGAIKRQNLLDTALIHHLPHIFCFTLLLRKLTMQNRFHFCLKWSPKFLISCTGQGWSGSSSCFPTGIWCWLDAQVLLSGYLTNLIQSLRPDGISSNSVTKRWGQNKVISTTPCLAKAPIWILFFSLPRNVHLLQFSPILQWVEFQLCLSAGWYF